MHHSHRVLTFLFATVAIFFTQQTASAASGVALGVNELVVINGAKCGLLKGSWVPGSILKSGNFYSLSQQIKDQKKFLAKKGLATSQKNKIRTKITALTKKLKKQKTFCKRAPSLLTPTPTPTSIATPLPDAVQIAWNRDVRDEASKLGGEYIFFCPANPSGALDSLYGTNYYTTDSAVCVAGAHAGIFKRGSGGNVKLRIKEGRDLYIGSVRNDIESSFYGAYASSYVFIDIATGAEILNTDIPQITWAMSAQPIYTLIDQQFSFYCPAGGSAGNIWGTDIYTYDSKICTAAVHAGLISFQNGGVITIQLKPGQASYAGSTRHGVTSSSYGSWGGSYIFVN